MMRFFGKVGLVMKTTEAVVRATNCEFGMVLREIATTHPDLGLNGRIDRLRPISNFEIEARRTARRRRGWRLSCGGGSAGELLDLAI